MTSLTPVAPSARDPKSVLVGLPAAGDPLFDLSRMVALLENHPNPYGWKFRVVKIGNQGLAKARNVLTFLARCSDASQIVMIDSDVPATNGHVYRLLDHPELVVGALYPKKEIPLAWVGEFREVDPKRAHPKGLWPMLSVGSGLVKVRLEAIDQLLGRWWAGPPHYESDEEAPAYGMHKGDRLHDIWGVGVVTDDWFGRRYPRYLTEDYWFSWLCRRAKIPLWVDPFCQVGHVGRCDFLEVNAKIEAEVERQLAAERAAERPTLRP